MENGKIVIWSSLMGFERNDSDRGASRFFKQTGFIPEAVCALVHHSDFFNLYTNMDSEWRLSPANCSYCGIPQNAERKRQPWTNYDLRTLSKNIKKAGSQLYVSIFGSTFNNAFHHEWVTDHPEIKRHRRHGAENASGIFPLKRFCDGTYYEDFFIDKVCRALTDYELEGVHLADGFCPASGMLHSLEFSTDYVEQFIEHSHPHLPDFFLKTLGCDTEEAESMRADWIWANLRAEWIRFNVWRWEVFFQKLCSAVHGIGKKIMVLGMYCTDPFETLYCLGIDLKRIVMAGVDTITANTLPTSCYFCGNDEGKEQRPYYFHRYMSLAATTAAFLPKGHLVTMVGLQDPTEEWSAMHHAPCQHERDLFTITAYNTIDENGANRATDGLMLCLGDGISKEDWKWERVRLEAALSANEVDYTISPAMLWSDNVQNNMLDEYIKTRRWTPFKFFYELAKNGAHCGATIIPEGLKNYKGTLFVPLFDLLSDEEKKLVASYRGGPVLCTAKDGFNPQDYGIKTEISITDNFSKFPTLAFAFNCKVSDTARETISALINEDDGVENLHDDFKKIVEPSYPLNDTLIFSKVTEGFKKALSLLLNDIFDSPFEINKANIIIKMKNGAYRLYLFNDSEVKYHRAFVKSKKEIVKTDTITKFPILPPRFVEAPSGKLAFIYNDEPKEKYGFEIKIQPGGVTVIDVYCKD